MRPSLHTDVVVEDESLVLRLGEESTLLGQLGEDEAIAIKASFHDYHRSHLATLTIGNGSIRSKVDQAFEIGKLDAGLKGVGMLAWILIKTLHKDDTSFFFFFFLK